MFWFGWVRFYSYHKEVLECRLNVRLRDHSHAQRRAHSLGVQGDAGSERAVDIEASTEHVADAFLGRARVVVVLVALRVTVAARAHTHANQSKQSEQKVSTATATATTAAAACE